VLRLCLAPKYSQFSEDSKETYAQAKNIAEQQISTVQAKTAGMTLADSLQAGMFQTATSI